MLNKQSLFALIMSQFVICIATAACEIDAVTVCSNDPCSPVNPCQNAGQCSVSVVSGVPGYQCVCTNGFWGTNCTSFNPCSVSSACYNGATCVNTSLVTYVCQCAKDFYDSQCQVRMTRFQRTLCASLINYLIN